MSSKMNVMVVCSAGGHYLEALEIIDGLDEDAFDFLFVTYKEEHNKNIKLKYRTSFVINPYRNILKFMLNFCQIIKIFSREKPDVLITTGASIAIPAGIVARLLHKKVIFIESAARVSSLSMTGKVFYRMSDLFFIQWFPLSKKYKKAVFLGDKI